MAQELLLSVTKTLRKGIRDEQERQDNKRRRTEETQSFLCSLRTQEG
jgi:hypothetical protein